MASFNLETIPPTQIGTLIRHILTTGYISLADEYQIFQAIARDICLSEPELVCVQVVSDRLEMGLLHLVD